MISSILNCFDPFLRRNGLPGAFGCANIILSAFVKGSVQFLALLLIICLFYALIFGLFLSNLLSGAEFILLGLFAGKSGAKQCKNAAFRHLIPALFQPWPFRRFHTEKRCFGSELHSCLFLPNLYVTVRFCDFRRFFRYNQQILRRFL